ncbi:MAG TPA: hypothetical protein VM869_08605 [Enhygromyxa sp.]|nr:hypothetical protein [Enhygromyxa sp.]
MFAWLWLSLRAEPPLHADTSRDLAFARDLVDGAELHLHGAWASFGRLVQGTAWIDLLALCQRLGLGIVGIDRTLTSLLAAAVAVTHFAIARLLAIAEPSDPTHARVGALAGAGALLATVPATIEMPIWWQPTLLPIVVALAHVALWRLLDRGELLDGLALGILSALALDIHVVSVIWFALPLVAVPLAAKRPIVTTCASAAALLGYLWLCSPAALSSNLATAREQGWVIPGLLVVVALIGAGLSLRSRFAALSLRRRLELAVAIEAMLIAVVVVASLLPSTPPLMGRYLLPFGPGVALAIALLGRGSRRRTLSMVGVAALLLLGSIPSLRSHSKRELPLIPQYAQRELEVIGRELANHTWTELVVRLQGPERARILGGLASRIDPGDPTAAAPEAGLLLLALPLSEVAALRPELPASTRTVELPDATVLLIETPGRLDRAAVSACTEAGECEVVTLAVVRRVQQAHPKTWVGAQTVDDWVRERDGQHPSWRYVVRSGPAAVLTLPPEPSPRCPWQFVASEGFELDGLPSATIELPPDTAGSLTIARNHDGDDRACAAPSELPPAPIELDPSWTGLRAHLGGSAGSG